MKETARNEFKLPTTIHNVLLPSPNISLKALAEFTLPATVEKPTMHKYMELYFTTNPSTTMTPAVLMCMQHLPMPERSTLCDRSVQQQKDLIFCDRHMKCVALKHSTNLMQA